MGQFLFWLLIETKIVRGNSQRGEPVVAGIDPFLMRALVFAGPDEVFHLHLFEFARAENEVAGRNFIAKRFANLRDAKGQLAAARRQDVCKVDEDTLRCFRAEISQSVRIAFSRRSECCFQHRIESARSRPVSRTTGSTLDVQCHVHRAPAVSLRHPDKVMISPEATLTFAAVYKPVIKRVFMSAVLPHQAIQNDRRVESFNVVALVDHPAPPSLLDVIAKLDAERTVVPGAAEAAVDFRRGKDKPAPLGEGNDGFDVRSCHKKVNSNANC